MFFHLLSPGRAQAQRLHEQASSIIPCARIHTGSVAAQKCYKSILAPARAPPADPSVPFPYATSQPPRKLLGCCRLCHWDRFHCYLPLLWWLLYPLPLTTALGCTFSLLGLDTASVWTGQSPAVLQLMEANENNKPPWHGAPLLLERAERWKSIR